MDVDAQWLLAENLRLKRQSAAAEASLASLVRCPTPGPRHTFTLCGLARPSFPPGQAFFVSTVRPSAPSATLVLLFCFVCIFAHDDLAPPSLPPTPALPHTPPPQTGEVKKLRDEVAKGSSFTCSICCAKDVDTVLVPCGHVMCSDCARSSLEAGRAGGGPVCPFDRKRVDRTCPFFRP